MKKVIYALFIFFCINSISQETKNIVENIIKEVKENSQLEKLAHELFDVVGPRLVGTPQMRKAHDWAISNYKSWGINAYEHTWGCLERMGEGFYTRRHVRTKNKNPCWQAIGLESINIQKRYYCVRY